MTEKNTAQSPTEATQTKHYARFTMLGFYTPAVAKAKSRSKQTFRDDITRLQYGDSGMNLSDLHSLTVLWKKYVELKYLFKTVIFYDNFLKRSLSGGGKEQVVLKIVLDGTQEHFYGDKTFSNYVDSAGKPLKCPLNDMLNENA